MRSRGLLFFFAFFALAGCASHLPPPLPSSKFPPVAPAYAHTRIVATTFWVGEVFDASVPDGSQVCSAYDAQWAFHWSGVDRGRVPENATACPRAILGGCDGIAGPSVGACETESRVASNGYFPSNATPLENPFYLDLPFDDINDETGFRERCSVIPWASGSQCANASFSFMKNAWVQIQGPGGAVCYGQIEDAGPSHDALYHDAAYVFGANDTRPVQGRFNDAGMDVSPALNGCLGFAELDGSQDLVSWNFVDASRVPAGPWRTLVTTSQVTPR